MKNNLFIFLNKQANKNKKKITHKTKLQKRKKAYKHRKQTIKKQINK